MLTPGISELVKALQLREKRVYLVSGGAAVRQTERAVLAAAEQSNGSGPRRSCACFHAWRPSTPQGSVCAARARSARLEPLRSCYGGYGSECAAQRRQCRCVLALHAGFRQMINTPNPNPNPYSTPNPNPNPNPNQASAR